MPGLGVFKFLVCQQYFSIVSFGQKTDLLLDVIFREPEDYDAANSSLLFSILFLWLFSVSMIHHLF